MKKNREIRAFNFEVRAENDEKNGNYITGRPIVYDSETDIGMFREIIERGALDDTDFKDVPFFVNHNIDMIPLARSRNNNENSTLQLAIDEDGLIMRANLDTENNQDARSLYSATERGDLDGMSFMFEVLPDGEAWSDLDTDKPLRKIKKVSKVWEISAVTFPAYEETSLTVNTRSRADVLENAKATLESVRKREKAVEIVKKLKGARDE